MGFPPDYFKIQNEEFEVKPEITTYQNNGSLAVALICNGELFAVLTVNIDDTAWIKDPAMAFVDTNNCPWAPEFLEKNQLAKPPEIIGFSGMCCYPLYEFDLKKIAE